MYSMPQQEVANGKGQSELARAIPTTGSKAVAKKPGPSMPGGAFTISAMRKGISEDVERVGRS
jgi:hypothetical protein